jgi:hypothetical protein
MDFPAWRLYFQGNKNHFSHINWKEGAVLTDHEKKIVQLSLQKFQRGEHSEGKHFLKFAASLNDSEYLEAVKLFIKEEQDHAAVLGKFMLLNSIPRLEKDWVDGTFRFLRKLAGLEGTVTVLLTAEIIAMVYYKALASAAGSLLLKELCRQILKDEIKHLEFQSYTLRVIYSNKPVVKVIFSRLLHVVLMAGTIGVVWFDHRKVLKAGGYSFAGFFSAVWLEFRKCAGMMRRNSYAAPQKAVTANVAE